MDRLGYISQKKKNRNDFKVIYYFDLWNWTLLSLEFDLYVQIIILFSSQLSETVDVVSMLMIWSKLVILLSCVYEMEYIFNKISLTWNSIIFSFSIFRKTEFFKNGAKNEIYYYNNYTCWFRFMSSCSRILWWNRWWWVSFEFFSFVQIIFAVWRTYAENSLENKLFTVL